MSQTDPQTDLIQLKIRTTREKRRQLKAAAALRGKSMTELLNDYIDEEINSHDFE
jgi:uncharacterized protein (DUF1778 family)